MELDKAKLSEIYLMMNKIRDFESSALRLFEENKLRGSVHLCLGQESIPATTCALMNPDDFITSTHRGHGHCIAKGADMRMAMAELMGKATGYCKGRGGSMHIADVDAGNLGANAIVGGGIPIAVGAALASKMQNQHKVAVSFFGDSATNEGTFHEALNMAAVWKLPVVFICENNGYGISVPQWQSTSVVDISVRAKAYGIKGVTVDGNDVLAVADAVSHALRDAREGEGPTLIECKTYRWKGHWTGDPETYRNKQETEWWKENRDPIKRLREYMIKNKLSTAKKLDALEAEAAQLAAEAVEFALNSPEPDPAHVLDDVFYTEEA